MTKNIYSFLLLVIINPMKMLIIYMLFLALSPIQASQTDLVYLSIEVVVAKGKIFNRFKAGTSCEVVKEENGRYFVRIYTLKENFVTFWVDKMDVTK